MARKQKENLWPFEITLDDPDDVQEKYISCNGDVTNV